jgi:hypothetical protein
MIFTNLLANMVVLTLQNTIPTNTPAFQEYAFHEMFSQSSNMIVSWNLDLPRPITTNTVTAFHAVPTSRSPKGEIILGDRFWFTWIYSGVVTFSDKSYCIMSAQTPDVSVNDALFEKWMRATNVLTMHSAQQLAESAMKSVGLPLDKLDFNEPKEIRQEKYRWTDGKVYLLPYYEFCWDTDKAYCTVDVSGILGRVVYFHFNGQDGPYLKFEPATNYLAMLGLPTNAVFVHRLSRPDKPPLYELREPIPMK